MQKLPTEIETSKEILLPAVLGFFFFFFAVGRYICYWYQVRTLSTTVWMCFLVPLYHIVKVRGSKRSKGTRNVMGNYPSCLWFAELLKSPVSYLNYISITVSYVSALSYWSRTVTNELEATFLTSSTTLTDQQKIWILATSFRRHVTGGSISFPYRVLRMASFLTAPADENKGNCILKQRPSCNPHNSCCLWCKYFREVRWPHSMAKAINNHKKYEPPSQRLIACVLHNALFAVSFKQFTISRTKLSK